MMAVMAITLSICFTNCAGKREKASRTANVKQDTAYKGKIDFKLFMENSGSMFPYETREGEGDFKNAISTLINEIPVARKRSEQIYVVNDAIYPYDKSFVDFLKSKDIYSETKGLGNINFTDFTCIFDTILNHTGKGELSILVSDLIYSTKDMEYTNTRKILNETRNMMTTIFKNQNDKSGRKDIVVIKLNGDYNGNYYAYNSPSKGVVYNGERPYYIMLVGNSDVMESVNNDPAFANFRDFSKLPGYDNFYCFQESKGAPYWSFMLSGAGRRGKYSKSGNGGQVHDIKNVASDGKGRLSLLMAVDLSQYITTEEYKTDTRNYEIDGSSDFSVERVWPIDFNSLTEAQRKYADGATHFILLTSKGGLKYGDMTLRFLNRMPGWIARSNSDDDTDINSLSFSSTTFGFKYMMEGIRDAYYGTDVTPSYFEIQFNMTK